MPVEQVMALEASCKKADAESMKIKLAVINTLTQIHRMKRNQQKESSKASQASKDWKIPATLAATTEVSVDTRIHNTQKSQKDLKSVVQV